MKLIKSSFLVIVFTASLLSQNITTTLGTLGVFTIKDTSTSFFTLSQSTGYLSLNRSLVLPNTTSPATGVIFKGADRFIHNYGPANTFLGINSGNFTLTTANYNTGIGHSTLLGLTTGNYNTAIGYGTLFSNSTGNNNTALGYYALYNNTTGGYNIALGMNSMLSNTTGDLNTAVGYRSLESNTTGSYNTAFGFNSLNSNTTGNSNISIGFRTLYLNTTGYQNTAIGDSSLFSNTTGNRNTAVGYQSLNSNTTGLVNTAVGYYSLYSNTTGLQNTAVGMQSLFSNTTGNNNTSLGYQSLFFTTGTGNTALGMSSLCFNTTGDLNTAVGYRSLEKNTTGRHNTAVGYLSLWSNTTGDSNTALGYGTGSTITTGSNLTCIGYDAEPTTGSATNQITLGNSFVNSLRCNVTTITSLSDMRDKKNIKDLNLGINFLMKLKPRIYNWDKREWYESNISDGSKMNESPTAGFIAQELDEAQITAGVEWLNLVLKDNPEKWEATPGNLLPIVVKAIQDLKAENDELSAGLLAEKSKNEKIEERLIKYEEMQNMLVKKIDQMEANSEMLKLVQHDEEVKFGEK